MAQRTSEFTEIVTRYVENAGYTPGQLSRLSGVPQATLTNWLNGRVQKPRQRDSLLHVAAALQLSELEASQLLRAAGHPSLETLFERGNEAEKALLAPWVDRVEQRREAPFQAIADLPYFVGRQPELQALRGALLDGQHVAICSVQGMGGAGKTALAAHVAYQLRTHFPDGVLWARVDRADPMSILDAFAQAYGRDVTSYTDVESRSGVVRELLAHKRALIVLDNAQSSQDVQPLLPPTGRCAVIITTRRHDLAITQGLHRIHLGQFDRAGGEALALFGQILGDEAVQRERPALLELAELVGHLPLALAIVAGRLALEPNWRASDMVRRLRDEKARLRELAAADEDVRASFNLSYGALTPQQRQFFAMLGVFGGEDFSVAAAAFVAKLSMAETHDCIRTLYSMSLVQRGRADRYRLHPLLRDFASEQLTTARPHGRALEYFIQFVRQQQMDFNAIEVESSNMVAALHTAHDHGMDELFIRGVNAFFPFFEAKGLYDQALHHLQRAHDAAQRRGDSAERVRVLCNLGQTLRLQNKYENARTHLQEGLALAQRIEFPAGIMQAHLTLGTISLIRGEYDAADAHLQSGLEVESQFEDKEMRCALFTNLGIAAGLRGDFARAASYMQQGLELARALGHRERICALLGNLGRSAVERNRYDDAEQYFREGLAHAHQIGHRERVATISADLGVVLGTRGEHEQADAYMQESLDIARELQHHWLISTTLNKWGRLCLARDDFDAAAESFHCALQGARKAGVREAAAEALFGLAQAAAAQGEIAAAQTRATESHAIYADIGHYNAEHVEQWLAALPLNVSRQDR